MFKNKQLINSDSDQSLTATTTTFETFEANEPTNNFGQSGKRLSESKKSGKRGKPGGLSQLYKRGRGHRPELRKTQKVEFNMDALSVCESTGGHPPANKLSNANDNDNHSLH